MQEQHGELTPSSVGAAIRNIHHPAAVIRPDLTIVDANAGYSRLFAGAGGEVVGRRCFRVSHGYSRPCDETGERCPLRIVTTDGRAVEAVHEHFTQRGKEREKVVVTPIRAADGDIAMYLEVLYEVESRNADSRLIGGAPAFRRMLALVDRVAPSEVPVLLLGESGTGKELVAREIHNRSGRRHHSFVPVDCSGLAETLFESELFGHERAAFTGATHAKRGLVEAATGGTLFLDEIGDVPLSQQVKLLRLLETGMFRRVGSVEQKHADFRLVCATHRDLRRMVEEGSFRRDLYYRINAFPIETPALRQRLDDLEILAQELLQRIDSRRSMVIAPNALDALRSYTFPGNVRELLNMLQRASLLADGNTIRLEDLPDDIARTKFTPAATRPDDIEFTGVVIPLRDIEERYLLWAATAFTGDRRGLAKRLGLSERTLYRRLAAIGAHLPDEPPRRS